MKTLRSYILHYVYGLLARSFNSAIAALCAFAGLAVGHAFLPSINEINWKGGLAVFLTTYVATALLYFRDHPIPEDLQDVTTVTAKAVVEVAKNPTAMSQPTPSA